MLKATVGKVGNLTNRDQHPHMGGIFGHTLLQARNRARASPTECFSTLAWRPGSDSSARGVAALLLVPLAPGNTSQAGHCSSQTRSMLRRWSTT